MKGNLVGIVLTVPDGGWCENKTQKCRFLQSAGNHPMRYCFLIPDANWSEHWNATYRKDPRCPSLYARKKCKVPSLEDEQNNRMRIWQQIEIKNTFFCPHCMKPIVVNQNDPDWEID